MSIKSKASTDEYREGWDRIFGKQRSKSQVSKSVRDKLCEHEWDCGLSHNDPIYVCKKCDEIRY